MKMMKKIFIALIIVSIVLVVITCNKNSNAIIIYSCLEQFRNDELQKQLDDNFPNSDVFVMYMPTAKAAAKISIEETKTDADIVIALENAYMEKIEQNMAPCIQYSNQEFLDDTKPKSSNYLTWERQSGSIIINRAILNKHNLPIPQTYEDLLNPVYKNMIAMPDPKSSGTGFFFLKSLINTMGEEEAFNYIDELADNIKLFTESGSGPIKLLKQGEVAIGLGLTFQGVNELNAGNDFLILQPEFGSPYSLTSVALLDGRQKNPEIVEIFKYIVNDFMIYDKTYFSPEPVLENQQNAITNYPENIEYADMTGIEDINEKERLLSKWKY